MVDKTIRIAIDSGPAEAGARRVQAALNQLKQTATAAVGKGIPVKIDTSNISKASAEVSQALRRATAQANQKINFGANSSGLISEIRKAEAAIESLKKQTAGLSSTSPIKLNTAGFVTDANRVIASLKAIANESEKASTPVVALGGTLKTVMAGAAAAAAAFGAASVMQSLATSVYAANAEYMKLMASLETVTGSARNAENAFAKIQKFAQETPFTLSQVTEAFIKLKALGLDASEASLRSFGNTSSAMGKSLNDMIEAVADASTGEMERLKEFGITAKTEGDKVTFTFQGVSKTVGKSAAEIQKYLTDIGNIQFAGGMARQAETLEGKFSNLTDKVNALYVKIGDAGLNKGLMNLFDSFGRLIELLGPLGSKLGWLGGVVLNDLSKFIGEVSTNLANLNDIAAAVGGGNTRTSVTVPVIDNVAGGMKVEQLGNLTATDEKPGPDQPLRKDYAKTFGNVMSLREAAEAPTPFILSNDDKPQLRSNVLRFARPTEDEKDAEAAKPPRSRSSGGGGRNIAEEFAKEAAAGKEILRTLALMDESYERGRGSVEGFRNSLEETNLRISAQEQFGRKNAEVLVDQAMAAKAYEESIAFKGEVLNRQEAIDQTVALAEAYKEGSVAVIQAKAAQDAWNTAVQLGMSSSPELVQQLTDLAVAGETANRFLKLETDLAGMDQQIESAARMATAYREGGAAIREATLEEQVRAAAVAAGLEWDEASVQKIRDRVTALRDLQEVQQSDEQSMMFGFDLEAAENELRLSQMVGEARYIEAERLQMLIDKKRELRDATATLTAEEERQADAMGRAKYAMDSQSTALEDLATSIPNIAYAFEEATRGALLSFEDALVDIVTGTKSAREAFADMARSIAADLARMAIRMAIIQPLAMLFGGMMGGGGAAVAAPVFGGFVSQAAIGPITWGTAHTGGVIGADTIGKRTLPRFHNGGMAANEVPAILEKGEGVFTREQMRNMAPVNNNSTSAPVTINVSVNQAQGGNPAEAENQGRVIAKHVEMAMGDYIAKQSRNGGMLNPNGGGY